MKQILIVNGSRTKNGNTAQLIELLKTRIIAIDEGVQTVIVDPIHYHLETLENPSDAFRYSDSIYSGVHDDYLIIKQLISDSDLVVLASPAYYANVTSDMKLFIDRFCHLAHLFYWSGTPSAVIASADGRGQTQVSTMLGALLDGFGMPRIAELAFTNTNPPNELALATFVHALLSSLKASWAPETSTSMEASFLFWKRTISRQNKESSEYQYWFNNGMFQCDTLQEYINQTND